MPAQIPQRLCFWGQVDVSPVATPFHPYLPAEVRRVLETGPEIPLAREPGDLARLYDPLHPDFPPSAETTLRGDHLALHFEAAANRDYVISCRVEESRSHRPIRDFGVRVEIDGRYSHMITALRRERGRISFAIEKATRRRGVDLQVLFASAAQDQTAMSENRHVARFSVSRCDITPLS